MIIGELTAGARILLEKGPSRQHISEDQQFAENIQKFLFCQIPEAAKRGGRGGPPWAHTMPWRGHPLGRAATWCGPMVAHLWLPFWLPPASGKIGTSGHFPGMVVLPKYGILTVLFPAEF